MGKRLFTCLLLCCLLLSPALAAESGADPFPALRSYSGFSDVAELSWYTPYVKVCYESGLMDGGGQGQFRPEGLVSGGEAIVLAARLHYRLAGGQGTLPKGLTPAEAMDAFWPYDKSDPEAVAFVTELQSSWYWDGLCYLMQQPGLEALTMNRHPIEPASRLEVAELLSFGAAALPMEERNHITALPDETSSSVLRLYQAGVLTGTDSSGSFRGQQFITRAELSTMLARILRPALRQSVTVASLEENYTLAPAPLNGNSWLPLEMRSHWRDSSRFPTAASLQYIIFHQDTEGRPLTGWSFDGLHWGQNDWSLGGTGGWGLMDRSGRVLIPAVYDYVGEPWDNSGVLPVMQNGKWGYLDLTGRTLLPCSYDAVSTRPGDTLLAWHKSADGKPQRYYVFDLSGALISQFAAEGRFIAESTNLQEGLILFYVEDSPHQSQTGYMVSGNRYGYLDQTGKTVIAPQFQLAYPFSQGHAVVEKWNEQGKRDDSLFYKYNWLVGVIDKTGAMTVPFGQDYRPDYYNPDEFAEGSFVTARMGADGLLRHGAITPDGETAVPHIYHSLGGFQNGMAFFRSGGQMGWLRHDGSRLMLPYQSADDFDLAFSGGYLAVSPGGGLYGYCDSTGRLVVPPQFSICAPVYENHALVETDDTLYLLTLTDKIQ